MWARQVFVRLHFQQAAQPLLSPLLVAHGASENASMVERLLVNTAFGLIFQPVDKMVIGCCRLAKLVQMLVAFSCFQCDFSSRLVSFRNLP